MAKKRILFVSNFSLANTGFGKYQKNLLSRLYKTGKYELCELACGATDADPSVSKLPWKVIGVLPKNGEEEFRFSQGDENTRRAFQYGLFRFDEAVLNFKPDVVICHEDIWGWCNWLKGTKTYGKFIPIAFHPLDAEPLSEEFVTFLKDFKYIYTYGKWSQEIGKKASLPQTQIATLGIDHNVFKPLDKNKSQLFRMRWGIKDTDYVVLMVARNQIRKKFDALFESLEEIKSINPELYKNIKILPFSFFADPPGLFFPKFWKSRAIDSSKILVPYFCDKINEHGAPSGEGGCKQYHIAHAYEGEFKNCPLCGMQKSCHTPSVLSGVTDEQLNEIYNLSDLFALPTSNEGFGLPVLEALAVGKMVLVTDYSTCKELADNSGAGFTIPCSHYVEFGTMFKKANLTPYNVAKSIHKIYSLNPKTRLELEAKARKYAVQEHNYDKLAKEWEVRLDEIQLLENVDWNVEQKPKNPNPNGQVPSVVNDIEWLCHLYKNILDTDIIEETKGNPLQSQGVQYWITEIKQNRRTKPEIEQFFRHTAMEDLKKKTINLQDLLDPNDSKRILYVMPQSCGDNFLSTSVISSIKEKYPNHSIYVASKPEFADVWKNNPHIKRWLPFADIMLSYGTMESRFNKGLFDICYTPTVLTQFQLPNWHHNSEDSI